MSNTSVVPYPCAGDPDPLPMAVTCERLSAEGFPAAEQHVREHLQREGYRSSQRTSRQRTSYWPCTDLDLAFPAINASPAGSATVRGSIRFARCTAGELLSALSAMSR